MALPILRVPLTQSIAPHFYGLWHSCKKFEFLDYWLIGGRGSTKSTFVAFRILYGLLEDPMANAVCYRQVKTDIRDSVMSQFIWCIYKLRLENYFRVHTSPARIVYLPTGQMILFRGMDDPSKTKSIKVPRGYIKYSWFEEGDQYDGIEAMNTATISTMRGGDVFQNFVSYNPPESQINWINVEAVKQQSLRYVHRSDYRGVPREWLGEPFIQKAEAMLAENERMYNHVYLGEVTGTGSEVFSNLKIRAITDDEIREVRNPRHGLDFGFENDPCALMTCGYDAKRKTILIWDEWVAHGKFEEDIYQEILRRGMQNQIITADSAEARAIARLQSMGARRMQKCYKAGGYVADGLKWLRSAKQIIIDPVRCPIATREFSQYEFEKLRDGTPRNEYPDRNNHCIDAVRYALEQEIRYGNVPRQF